MNVSYIEEIFNNTKRTFAMWSTDSQHNGVFDQFDSGQRVGDNDWGHTLVIQPGARLKASWCGIPWYQDGTCYRVIAQANSKVTFGLRMYQSETDEGDGIHFINHKTGRPIRQGGAVVPFPRSGDRQFALTIDEIHGVLEFKLWNRQTKTAKQEFVNTLGQFAQDYYDDTRTIRIEMAKVLTEVAAEAAVASFTGG